MSILPSDKIIDQMIEILDGSGITDYIFCFRDPDSDLDSRMRCSGSLFWRIGVGTELIDDAREIRKQDRSECDEEDE